jgi:hypothetical protein
MRGLASVAIAQGAGRGPCAGWHALPLRRVLARFRRGGLRGGVGVPAIGSGPCAAGGWCVREVKPPLVAARWHSPGGRGNWQRSGTAICRRAAAREEYAAYCVRFLP